MNPPDQFQTYTATNIVVTSFEGHIYSPFQFPIYNFVRLLIYLHNEHSRVIKRCSIKLKRYLRPRFLSRIIIIPELIAPVVYFEISQASWLDREMENDLCIIYKLIIRDTGRDRLKPRLIGVTRPIWPPFKLMYIIIFLVYFCCFLHSSRRAAGNNFYNETFPNTRQKDMKIWQKFRSSWSR